MCGRQAGGHFSSVWQAEGATDSAAAAWRSSHAAPTKPPAVGRRPHSCRPAAV